MKRWQETHICNYCLKRLSLGKTEVGWLGCVVCQKNVDDAIAEWRNRNAR